MPAGTTTRPERSPAATRRDSRSRAPAGVGRTLRQARILAGIQLYDVAVQTGVEAKYLRALEWERFDLLPSSKLTCHAAQSMAQVLQLDPALISAELEQTRRTLPRHGPVDPQSGAPPAATGGAEEAEKPVTSAETLGATTAIVLDDAAPTELATRSPWATEDPEVADESSPGNLRTRNARLLLGGALLLGVVLFLIVDLLVLRDDEPTGDVPAAAESAATVAQTAAGSRSAGGNETLTPATRGVSPGGAATAGGAATTPAAGAPASGGDATAGGTSEQPGDEAPLGNGDADSSTQPASGAPKKGNSPTAVAGDVQQVEIAAVRGTSWLQIRRGSNVGPVLYEGLLQRGNVLTFSEKALFMRIGAASAINIVQDGTTVSKKLEGTVDLTLTRKSGVRLVS